MVCPICRHFNAATVMAVNAHIDSYLAQAVRDEWRQTRRTCPKLKAKAPKKRSIAEILTVAPPIEAIKIKSKAIEVEEEEDSSSDYCDEDSSVVVGTVVSTIKSKKSANKDRKKKKTKKAKKKEKNKLQKHCDSGFYLSNEKKTVVIKKKKKKNVFNNELIGKKDKIHGMMGVLLLREGDIDVGGRESRPTIVVRSES